MRRKDKEISDIAIIEDILSKVNVCRLGMCDANRPYVVPLCFGYKDNALYIHCAGQGKKLDILRKNNNVCFEVDTGHEIVKTDQSCGWSMKYKSVIGFGKAVFIEDIESRQKALDIIMRQFSAETFEYPLEVIKKTTIIKIEIQNMTGKQSGY